MNYLDTVKNIFENKEKRVQNLVLLVVLLVIVLIASKYIFATKKTSTDNANNGNSTSTGTNINSNDNNTGTKTLQSDLENKLSVILSQISGISNVSVVLTYSQDSTQKPVYNTKEEENGGKKTTEKNVAYNESSGSKSAIIETVEMPKVEGAIVVAKGASSVDIRSKLASAISTVTGLPVYKVQVFEKQG